MAGIGPLGLAAAVKAVALILDGQPVGVLSLEGRHTCQYELTCAAVTVSVHMNDALDVDHAADLLGLSEDLIHSDGGLYSRAADWLPGVHVSFYGPAQMAAGAAGVGR